jgi:hypothetical protein
VNKSIEVTIVLIQNAVVVKEFPVKMRFVQYYNWCWIRIKLSEAQEEAEQTFIAFGPTANHETAYLLVSRTVD